MLKIKNKKGEVVAELKDEDTAPTFIKDKKKNKKEEDKDDVKEDTEEKD